MHGWEHLRDEDRDLILRGIEEGRALGGPYHVELDPIDVCNADCFFCNSAELRQGAVFHWERLEPIVDRLLAGGLRSFRLAGGGEPTLYPQLGPLLDKMAAAGVVMDNLTTNGIRMGDPILDELLKVRTTNYYISLNYHTPARYEQFMRTPANRFEWVVANMRRLDERLRAEGRRDASLIHTQFFVHHTTLDDVCEIVDFAQTLPIDSFTLRSAGLLPPEEDLNQIPADLARLPAALEAAVERNANRIWMDLDFHAEGLGPRCADILLEARYGPKAYRWARERGEEVPDPPTPEQWAAAKASGTAHLLGTTGSNGSGHQSDTSDRSEPSDQGNGTHVAAHDDGFGPGGALRLSAVEYCYIAWYSMVIQGNGDVHPCCFLMPLEQVPPFGNLNERSLDEVWQGPLYAQHRAEMRTVMLMQRLTPKQERTFRCTMPMCWASDRCPLANHMAEPDFYLAAHERLERLRRRPLVRLERLRTRAARRLATLGS